MVESCERFVCFMSTATYQPRPYAYQPPNLMSNMAGVHQASAFETLGFNVLLVFLFLAFSRIFDVKFGNLHITGVAYRVTFAMVLLSGSAFSANTVSTRPSALRAACVML